MNPINKFGNRRGWHKESKRHALARQGIKTAKTTTERRMDFIKGGLADNKPDSMFDSIQLARGIKVEMEHTDNPAIAKEISKDHLQEFPTYYSELEKMEKKLEKKKTIAEGQIFHIDVDFEGEILVDNVKVVETPKSTQKKVLVYSPKLRANILIEKGETQ